MDIVPVWPETMLTFEKEGGILFSCDLFGSHIASSDLFSSDIPTVYRAAKRYYAEIMMPFRQVIEGYLQKLKSYDIKIIAPSHGPVYRPPDPIISAYSDWTSDSVSNSVVIVYVSMHGSTEKMVNHLAGALMERDIPVKSLISRTRILARLLWPWSTLQLL
jgi:flavorubredoxin